jgi:hypothetical protein
MASAPPRQTFTKKKIPFSHIEKVEPGNRSRSESMRSIGTEYSDAYPVEIENIDPKMEAMKATYLEEQRSLASKAQRQQNKTQKVKIMSKQEALAKQIANIIKPGARVVVARKAGTRKIKRRRTQKKKRV